MNNILAFNGENSNEFYGKEFYKYGEMSWKREFRNYKNYKQKELIFDGEFKNEERWNDKAYNNLSEFSYINGKVEGNIVVYDYINHELFEGEYKNGEKYNGKLKTYFDDINHILKREVEIKNGEIDGNGREYYGNKRLKYLGIYKNGKPNGNGILYYEFFGHIKYIGEFKNGMRHGKGEEYDKYGNLIYQGQFYVDNHP